MTSVAVTSYRGWRGSPRSVSEISQLGSFSHHLSALRLISLVKTRCTTTDERSHRSTSLSDPIPVLKQHEVNLRLLHPFINLFHQQSTSSGLNINIQTGIAPGAIPRPSAAFHLGHRMHRRVLWSRKLKRKCSKKNKYYQPILCSKKYNWNRLFPRSWMA